MAGTDLEILEFSITQAQSNRPEDAQQASASGRQETSCVCTAQCICAVTSPHSKSAGTTPHTLSLAVHGKNSVSDTLLEDFHILYCCLAHTYIFLLVLLLNAFSSF